jgi:hypothetical protein
MPYSRNGMLQGCNLVAATGLDEHTWRDSTLHAQQATGMGALLTTMIAVVTASVMVLVTLLSSVY